MAATTKADGAEQVAETIAAMPDADRAIAERLHDVITKAAPDLTPRLWYGQPAYAKGTGRNGKVVVFFRGADVDGERYLTLGFSSEAQVDEGAMWPTAYAVTKVTKAVETQVADLVRRAVG